MAAEQDTNQSLLTTLPSGHFSAIQHAMSRMLGSELALQTYSQVVNGIPVPIPGAERDTDRWWLDDNPNPAPSQKAYAIATEFRDEFRVEIWSIDTKVGT
jgi:hypothetical protein